MPDLKSLQWFKYKPTMDTGVAALTAIIWIGGYYLLTHLNDPQFSTLYYVAAILAVVLFPLWWVCRHRGRPLAEIGITSRRWKESLLISVVVAIPFLWLILTQYGATFGDALIPHVLANALYLWEPFFVFCWLELQFNRSFGIIPGIVLAGVCFGAYHLGTYPLPGVAVLMAYGIVFAAIFSITENLLSLWPVAWAASSAKGTLAGGMVFSWDVVTFSAVIVLVQLLCIAWAGKEEKAGKRKISE